MRRIARGWDVFRGELVGLVGLIGDILVDWSRDHAFSKRELEEIYREPVR